MYDVGEFKDDQLQNHRHGSSGTAYGGGWIATLVGGTPGFNTMVDGGNVTTTVLDVTGARNGTLTRGKRKGVNYIIKA